MSKTALEIPSGHPSVSKGRYAGISPATRGSVDMTEYEGPLQVEIFIAPRYNAFLLPTSGMEFHPARAADYTDRLEDNFPHSDGPGAYWLSGTPTECREPGDPYGSAPRRRSALRGKFVWAGTPEEAGPLLKGDYEAEDRDLDVARMSPNNPPILR